MGVEADEGGEEGDEGFVARGEGREEGEDAGFGADREAGDDIEVRMDGGPLGEVGGEVRGERRLRGGGEVQEVEL